MRIVQVVAAITEEASGPSYSVTRLSEALIRGGAAVELAALDWAPMANRPDYLRTFPVSPFLRRIGISPTMKRWLREKALSGKAEIMHTHGLWMMPNVYPAQASRKSGCRLVVSPRGTLSPWARRQGKLQKDLFWSVYQKSAIRVAACLHATADSEYEDIRENKLQNPVCILPNGIEIGSDRELDVRPRRRLLFLGRIHPKKGVDVLLRAWAGVQGSFPDWDLEIVGPDNGGYLQEMQALSQSLKLQRVGFAGPLYGARKRKAYEDASLFVLPTHSENFGMTVAEALAAATPVIVTRGAPWEGVVKHDAGWWIEGGVESLVACLDKALSSSPERLHGMGVAGQAWMRSDFNWDAIAAKFATTYRWLIEGGERPGWVRVD